MVNKILNGKNVENVKTVKRSRNDNVTAVINFKNAFTQIIYIAVCTLVY